MSKTDQRLFVTLAFAGILAACGPTPAPVSQTPPPLVSTANANAGPAAEQFAAVALPTSGEARVIGSYTRGCIAGARQLPLDAPHWQVLNPSRNRAWGHPALIRFIDKLAAGYAADGYRGLLVGDLAQPRGGPLPSDHNSHQVGLDADIWLTPLPAHRFAAGDLETFDPPPMVDLDKLTVIRGRFGAAQIALLKRAAQAPEVERIFVSPPIKRELCKLTRPSERNWLRKIRPWRGHTEHMHVRLSCPADSLDCKAQDEPPDGDGCGAELASWFKELSWTKEGSTPYSPDTAIKMDALPAECRKLLSVERDHG